MQKQLNDLKESKGVYTEIMDDADDQLEIWDKLKNELDDGKTVYAPTLAPSGKKRKATGTDKPRKKRRAEKDSDDDESIHESEGRDYEDDEINDEAEPTDEDKDPLTEEQVDTKIAEIKANKKKARQEKAELDGKIKALATEIKNSQVRALDVDLVHQPLSDVASLRSKQCCALCMNRSC